MALFHYTCCKNRGPFATPPGPPQEGLYVLLQVPSNIGGFPKMLLWLTFRACFFKGPRGGHWGVLGDTQQKTNNEQQTTSNKQQTTNNKQHTTNNKQQTTNSKEQTTNNEQQTTENNNKQQHNKQQTTNNKQPPDPTSCMPCSPCGPARRNARSD